MPVLPFALALLLAAATASAASGGAAVSVAHDGYLLDGTDEPFTNPALPMTFRLVDRAALEVGETVEWEATCTVDVRLGYYAVMLGAGACAGSTTLDTADLPPSEGRWLEVAIGGTTLAPRRPIAPVPAAALAARALTADLLGTHAPSDFAPVVHQHPASDVTGLGALAAADSIRDADVASDAAISASKIGGLAPVATSGSFADLSGSPVGTLLEGKWCTASGGQIVCASEPPATGAGGSAGTSPGVACAGATTGAFWFDTASSTVKVCNGASYVTVSVVAAPPGAPPAPVVAPIDGALAVSWSAVSGAESYEVGYAAGASLGASPLVLPAGASTNLTVTGLTNGQAYAVAVRSAAGTYRSSWSAVATGTPQSSITCHTRYLGGDTTSGVKSIDPDGPGGSAPFNVYCAMGVDAAGWAVIQYGSFGGNTESDYGNPLALTANMALASDKVTAIANGPGALRLFRAHRYAVPTEYGYFQFTGPMTYRKNAVSIGTASWRYKDGAWSTAFNMTGGYSNRQGLVTDACVGCENSCITTRSDGQGASCVNGGDNTQLQLMVR